MAKQKNSPGEIRMTGVPAHIMTDLNNISSNVGISIPTLLKPVIYDYVEKCSPEKKSPPKKD